MYTLVGPPLYTPLPYAVTGGGTNSPCPVCKNVKYTILCRQVMVTVPVEVLVCVGRLTVNYSEKCIVRSR